MTRQAEAKQIIATYLAEVERTAGPAKAASYKLWYKRGWVYFQVGSSRLVTCYRLADIQTMTENLRERSAWKGDQ